MILPDARGLNLSNAEKELWNSICRFNKANPKITDQQKSLRNFEGIISIIRREKIPIDLVPKVFLKASFDMRMQDFDRARSILNNAQFVKDQFILLDSVPVQDSEVKRQFDNGFPVVIENFTHIDFHENVKLESLSNCKTNQELHSKLLLHFLKINAPIDFHCLVHLMKLIFSSENNCTLQNKTDSAHRDIALFVAHLIDDSHHSSRVLTATQLNAVVEQLLLLKLHGGQKVLKSCMNTYLNKGQFDKHGILPKKYIAFLRHVNELMQHKEFKVRICKQILSQNDAHKLIASCHLLYQQWYDKNYQQKSLDQVRKDFLSVQNSLHPEILNLLIKDFELVHQLYLNVNKWSDTEIRDFVSSYKQKVMDNAITHENKLELIAVIREGIRRHFGILPHNTQVIAFLGAIHHELYEINHTQLSHLDSKQKLKGHVPQVNTGEGKSTIIAMKSVFFAVHGRTVDVITSSGSLAIRDLKKYQKFYEFFNINSSHICVDSPQKKHYEGQIIYGQNTDFEFGYLRQELYFDDARSKRAFDIAIVDEIDNMLIDKGQNNSIIAIGENSSGRPLLLPILEMIKKNGQSLTQFQLSYLIEQFIATNSSQVFTPDVTKALESVDRNQLYQWFSSCNYALYHLKENVDYIVGKSENDQYDQIIIIDKATGKQEPKSRWQNKIHEFLELKHNLPVHMESYTGAEISHPVFFGFYKNIYGLTGTLGSKSERRELLDTFQIGAFDVPPHNPSIRKVLKPFIAENELVQFDMIAKEISQIQNGGRPILVLTDTISLSLRLSQFLNQNNIQTQILNSLQAETEELIIKKAGTQGVVTVATNTASRGTDIDINSVIKQNGGLHVVLAYYPENERVEAQGVGRSARQGAAGSSRLILNRENLPFNIEDIQHLKSNVLLEKLAVMRFLNDTKNISNRKSTLNSAREKQLLLQEFYSGIRKINEVLDTQTFMKLATSQVLQMDDSQIATSSLRGKTRSQVSWSSMSHSERVNFLDAQKQDFINRLSQLWGEIYSSEDRNNEFKAKLESIFSRPALVFESYCAQAF